MSLGPPVRVGRTVLVPVTEVDVCTLIIALACHADSELSDDATVVACWDADRLDFPRVGIIPDSRYMSTAAGRAAVRRRTVAGGVT